MSSNLPIINITSNSSSIGSCSPDAVGTSLSAAATASPHIIVTTPSSSSCEGVKLDDPLSPSGHAPSNNELVTVLVEGEEVELDGNGEISKVGEARGVGEVTPDGNGSGNKSQVRQSKKEFFF